MNDDKPHVQRAAGSDSATRSLLRSFADGGTFLSRHIWIWPIIAAVLMGGIGWLLQNTIENKLRSNVEAELRTILAADVKALQIWMRSQETICRGEAANPHLRQFTQQLIDLAKQPETTQLHLLQAPEQNQLREELKPVLDAQGYVGFVIAGRDLKIVASQVNELVGVPVPDADQPAVIEQVLNGKPSMSAPRKSVILLPDDRGQLRVGVPTMFVWSPIRNADDVVVAALGLRIRPDREFTEILSVGRAGESGETYAFNHEGLMLSLSRFDDDLRGLGLLNEDERSILNLSLRDPGANLKDGERAGVKRSEQPFTVPVAAAIESQREGVEVNTPYRDYRGVSCVGAWTWLPEYGMGIVTEEDSAEAFGPVHVLRRAFWGVFALLGGAAIAIFLFTIVVARLNRESRLAALKVRQLGQYTLDEKLGEGGMGVVYRGHHAMLQRPTAVKFLHPESTNERSIARFEREVRLTARLNHPNTIAIYDFGRTPEGVFYYAMEYLDGINLEDLVRRFGWQPANRVIHILHQVCSSLSEAHRNGLIHRDIKPANIMLTERGGLYDFVKLLDFGLVKAVDSESEMKLTAAGSVTGTPLYMSPEAVVDPNRVDARSDIYAVGAVGYFLLTGAPVFNGSGVLDILQKHAQTLPEPPTKRVQQPISTELEAVLLACLAKKREDRPASAEAVIDALAKCPDVPPWDNKQAECWWITHGFSKASAIADTSDTGQLATLIGTGDDAPEPALAPPVKRFQTTKD